MSAQSDPRRVQISDADPKYYYRRSLTVRELLPAVGAAVGAAVAAFYVVKVLLERTPLRTALDVSDSPRLTLHRSDEAPLTARNRGRR